MGKLKLVFTRDARDSREVVLRLNPEKLTQRVSGDWWEETGNCTTARLRSPEVSKIGKLGLKLKPGEKREFEIEV